LTALLVRALRLPDVPAVALPADLTDHWAAPLLRAAMAAGLISEGEMVGRTLDAPVPRWKAAQMLAAAMAVRGRPLPPPDALPGYTDLGTAPRPALDAIARVTAAGLMQGYPDGTFAPADSLTRGQTAGILFRLLGHLEQLPGGAPASGPEQGATTNTGPEQGATTNTGPEQGATTNTGPGQGGPP
ncbi:MAG: S-layer homology domain-containing protein, partial [Bacillota bacterium]